MRVLLYMVAVVLPISACTTAPTRQAIHINVQTELANVELAKQLALKFLAARDILPFRDDLVVVRQAAPARNQCEYEVILETCGGVRMACMYKTCVGTFCRYEEPKGVDDIETQGQCLRH
jgi:hypothetical protein